MAAKKKAAAKKTSAKKRSAAKKTVPTTDTGARGASASKKKPSARKVAQKKTPAAKKAVAKKAVAKKKTTKEAAARKTASKSDSTARAVAGEATAKKKMAVAKKAAAATIKKSVTTKKKATKKRTMTANPPDTVAKTDLPSASQTPGTLDDYMNDAQLEYFREKLLEWKRQLMQEVDRTVDHMKDDATNFPDPNDRATQEEEFSLELRTRDRERKLIKKIDESMRDIESGDYGFCQSCGIEIGVQRLEARPTATLCIDCKTMAEIRERQSA